MTWHSDAVVLHYCIKVYYSSLLLDRKNNKSADGIIVFRLASSLCKHISKLLGLHWKLHGKEYLENDEACVIVANHQSSLDILGELLNTYFVYAVSG